MARCVNCGKGPQFGQNRPFSLKATKRQFKVNIQKVSTYVGGQRHTVSMCTRCLRTVAKHRD